MSDSTFVYIIATMNFGRHGAPVKVGVSRDPLARVRELQTGNPYELMFSFAFRLPSREDALKLEAAFHKAMAHKAMEGEWFAMSAIDAAEAMCANIRAYLRYQVVDDESEMEAFSEYCLLPQMEEIAADLRRSVTR